MTTILLITLSTIILYSLYPVFLLLSHEFPVKPCPPLEGGLPVSLILLTYNGENYILEKIKRLAGELEHFHAHELIIIDDKSNDGTVALIESLQPGHNFQLVLKERHMGIPHSMNLGVSMAKYDNLIFCDQRQQLPSNFLAVLLSTLQDENVGAVSACIDCCETGNHISFLRAHENYLKKLESRCGYLVGVYGPLYAIKKNCYEQIEENVILDDLYLSLKILSGKRMLMSGTCLIKDDGFSNLYNFPRSKRYLQGLIQILTRKKLRLELPVRVQLMLLWHKYLRLLIPPLVVICYLVAAWRSPWDTEAAFVFSGLSFVFLISFLARGRIFFADINSFFRINFFYCISMLYLVFTRIPGISGKHISR